ncbi:hypothetical protein M2324_000574 [Rhodovulum sulfidophilum]|nr:hypothetical protein A6W98_12850 [Rhodovulum sulfidophilum DSM 1374]ANB38697.1 hypothetical protein A6024_12715 [Rhodovulum sulfidophilum]MCW2302192.1 hypothetical protein [Rhodovulum sulfidophilum]
MTPVVKREAVAHLKALFGLSERRACRVVGADRKMVRYEERCDQKGGLAAGLPPPLTAANRAEKRIFWRN